MKHRHHLTRALALISLLAAAPAALAQTPALVPYQGRVQTGTPAADFTGTGQFKFALMQGTTATRLWNNNGALTADPAAAVGVTVTNGLYSVMLGDTSLANMAAIPPSVFANPDVRLRVWFNGTQLSPDQRLAPNGYVASSLPAGIGIGSADRNAALSVAGGQGQTALELRKPGDAPGWQFNPDSGGLSICERGRNCSRLFIANGDTNGGNLGIGTVNPQGDLHVLRPNGQTKFTVGDTATGKTHIFMQTSASADGYSEIQSIKAQGTLYGDLVLNRDGGAVGIGTPSPDAALTIKASTALQSWKNISGTTKWNLNLNSFGTEAPGLYFGQTNVAASVLVLREGGNVGIGTQQADRARLVVAGSVAASPTTGRYMSSGSAAVEINSGSSKPTSVYADNWIGSGQGFYVDSDVRIKELQGRSNTGADLSVLRALEVTDYQFKDRIGNGGGVQKKVIAQQVEKVFPLAVSKSTGVVPDIFRKAQIVDGWVSIDTDVKAGERIRLIAEDETSALYDIAEVKAGAFRTTVVPKGSSVFVYGREVNDFRSVDYDAIAMLNVSATQELARQLDAKSAEVLALQKENAALKAALAENASKDKAQDEQLAALAKLLEDRAPSAGVTTIR